MKNINYVRFKQGQLWTETFGSPSNPVVLLIAGAEKQGIYWRESFCQRIAEKGYYVIRFDHRDTGLSTHLNFNASPYRLKDMVRDILDILVFYKKEQAHFIGSGMGGYLAQMLALSHPQTVLSLVLLMTTHDATLLERKVQEAYKSFSSVEPTLKDFWRISVNDPHWLSKTLQKLRFLNGGGAPFDEMEWEQKAIDIKSRMHINQRPVFFHHHLLAKTLSPLIFKSEDITQPTLIIHGDRDPLIPMEQAMQLNGVIPHSKFACIKNMGHLLTSFFENDVLQTLIQHLGTGEKSVGNGSLYVL